MVFKLTLKDSQHIGHVTQLLQAIVLVELLLNTFDELLVSLFLICLLAEFMFSSSI